MPSEKTYTETDNNGVSQTLRRDSSFDTQLIVHDLVVPDFRARLAIEFMKTNSILLAEPDGEDSQGRQAMRLLPPKQVVKRAVAMAEAAFEEMDRRGWLLEAGELVPLVQ